MHSQYTTQYATIAISERDVKECDGEGQSSPSVPAAEVE